MNEHPITAGFVSGSRTICEVHREMYDIVIEKECVDEKLVQLLEESFVMAKKMDKKLRQHQPNYDHNLWEKNDKADYDQKLDRRKRRNG